MTTAPGRGIPRAREAEPTGLLQSASERKHPAHHVGSVRLHGHEIARGPRADAMSAARRHAALTAGEVEGGQEPAQLAGDGTHVLAHTPPRPDAVARALTPDELADAITYNTVMLRYATEISILRRALGAPDGDVIDEDFVLAVVQFQAVNGIRQDGKLGPTTSGRLSRELRAEARLTTAAEARPLQQAARQRDRYSFNITVTQAPVELTNTGSGEYRVRWSVPDLIANGWIVQHVRFTGAKTDHVGTPIATNTTGAEYWEGWQVRAGTVFVGGSASAHNADTFRTVDEGAGTRGQLAITGRVTFLPGYDLRQPPWGHTVPAAGSLPTVTATPAGWSDGFARLHRMVVTWDDTVAPATHSVTATP
ncbi:MAG TPA: peptidoglycan-binding domain-containing protein [Humibacillus xanthopallidus]|nr:peptidoglycan-binding domain-containing protein [Humibacillus xanthopallidus]